MSWRLSQIVVTFFFPVPFPPSPFAFRWLKTSFSRRPWAVLTLDAQTAKILFRRDLKAQCNFSLLLSFPFSEPPKSQKTLAFLLVTFSWLFRGPFLLEKQCSGLFRYFFVVFSWPPFWANFTRTRPGTVFCPKDPVILNYYGHINSLRW